MVSFFDLRSSVSLVMRVVTASNLAVYLLGRAITPTQATQGFLRFAYQGQCGHPAVITAEAL